MKNEVNLLKNRLERLGDSNEISFEVKLFLPGKEIKTRFGCILSSQFQITNEEKAHKTRKRTQVILRGMTITKIWDSY